MPAYLDCNATTPLDPRVGDLVRRYLEVEFGNAGSRTHGFGLAAKQAVQHARRQVAEVAAVPPEQVIFTSGATESNNLALLGLREYAEKVGKRHIVSTQIEHKAVLEPLSHLSEHGFEVTLLRPGGTGRIVADDVSRALREDTVLVSVMHANNETGVVQPIAEIAEALATHDAYFHVDAAQTFGKETAELRNPRIDMLSASAHKLYGPKGVGALVLRRRGYTRPPLVPLMFGGGQERGLRPGTAAVPLIAGFGLAAELAMAECAQRRDACLAFRRGLLAGLAPLDVVINGDPEFCQAHIVNVSIPGVNSEAAMLALKGILAISNGSACTSRSYEPSHVLTAMGLDQSRIDGALRFSWCHMTEKPDWDKVVECLARLL